MSAPLDRRSVDCPTCMVKAGEPCTAPTDDGRRVVNWTHYARQAAASQMALALEVQRPEPEPKHQIIQEPRFIVLKEDGGMLLFDDMREAEAVAIVEHGAMYRLALHQDYRD